jgi:hypothetical protein
MILLPLFIVDRLKKSNLNFVWVRNFAKERGRKQTTFLLKNQAYKFFSYYLKNHSNSLEIEKRFLNITIIVFNLALIEIGSFKDLYQEEDTRKSPIFKKTYLKTPNFSQASRSSRPGLSEIRILKLLVSKIFPQELKYSKTRLDFEYIDEQELLHGNCMDKSLSRLSEANCR